MLRGVCCPKASLTGSFETRRSQITAPSGRHKNVLGLYIIHVK